MSDIEVISVSCVQIISSHKGIKGNKVELWIKYFSFLIDIYRLN